MAAEHRLWEGAASLLPESLNTRLQRLLTLLAEPEPAWASVDALLHEREDGQEAWKRMQRALTALHVSAPKRVHAERVAGRLVADQPAHAELRAAGWEPYLELLARLVRMWGPVGAPDLRDGWSHVGPNLPGPWKCSGCSGDMGACRAACGSCGDIDACVACGSCPSFRLRAEHEEARAQVEIIDRALGAAAWVRPAVGEIRSGGTWTPGIVERGPVCSACSARAVWGATACSCGAPVTPGRTRLTWERLHEGGLQAGQPVRCHLEVHSTNVEWHRIRWASWREGLRAPATRGSAIEEALGVSAADVFGGTAEA